MDKSINKRLSQLGVSNQEIHEEKRVEIYVNNMTSIEALRALKERYIDRRDELLDSLEGDLVREYTYRISTVNECINLISKNKERDEMLKSIKYLLRFVVDWEGEVPKDLTPMDYLTGDYGEDVKIKNKIDKIRNIWGKEIEGLD